MNKSYPTGTQKLYLVPESRNYFHPQGASMWNITPAIQPVTIFMLSLSLCPMAALGDDLGDFDRRIGPVEVSGHALSSINRVPTENIRVYASRNNKLLPIPFQIDQKNAADDWVWTTIPDNGKKQIPVPEGEDSDVLLTRSKDLTVDDQDPQSTPVFDSNDVLVFMARDVGNRHATAPNKPGTVVVELEISDPQKRSRGWVYIVHYASNPPVLTKQRYVTYQESRRRVVAPDYELTYSPEHSVMLDELKVNGASILERSRISGKVNAGMGPFATTMEFDERAIDGYDAGYINGPVRVIKRSVDHVKFGAGMRSPDVNCDHYYYPWHAEIPMLFSMRFPVKGVEMLAASRYRKDVFSQARIPQMTESISIGSGQSNVNRLAGRKDATWLGLYGDRLAVVTRIKIPESIGDDFSIEPYLAHDSGQALEAGYFIQTRPDIRKGEHVLHSVILILADSDAKDMTLRTSNLLDNKLRVEAKVLQ